MKKLVTIFFLIISICTASIAENLKIESESSIKIQVKEKGSSLVNFNFRIKDAELVLEKEDDFHLKLLKKGFIITPQQKEASCIVIVTTDAGTSFMVKVENNGKQDVFKIDDIQIAYNKKNTKKVKFETNKTEADIRNTVKALLLNKKLNGFSLRKSATELSFPHMKMKRKYRLIGNRYVIDAWDITNTTEQRINIYESDLYTKGIIANALEKNAIEPQETIYFFTWINKSSLVEELNQ